MNKMRTPKLDQVSKISLLLFDKDICHYIDLHNHNSEAILIFSKGNIEFNLHIYNNVAKYIFNSSKGISMIYYRFDSFKNYIKVVLKINEGK